MGKKFSSKYGEYDVDIKISSYTNGQIRIDLIDTEDGFPVAVASTSIEEKLSEGEVAIKNYSENEGVLKFLMREGIISSPIRRFKTGYVDIPICIMNSDFSRK